MVKIKSQKRIGVKEMNNKHIKEQEILLALFIVFGVVIVAGLVVVPVLEEVDAKCEGTKKNGDLCKPKKEKA